MAAYADTLCFQVRQMFMFHALCKRKRKIDKHVFYAGLLPFVQHSFWSPDATLCKTGSYNNTRVHFCERAYILIGHIMTAVPKAIVLIGT